MFEVYVFDSFISLIFHLLQKKILPSFTKINYFITNYFCQTLISDCRATADVIPRLVEAVKGTIGNPDDANAHSALLTACDSFLTPANKMSVSVKAALPTVNEPASNLQLTNCNRFVISPNKAFRHIETLFIQGNVFIRPGTLLVGTIPPTNSKPVQ